MKANELRINNYVADGGDVTQVESIADDMINVFYHNVSGVTGCYIGDLVPVQLTEQWLKVFGLHPKNNYFKQLGILYSGRKYIAAFDDNEFGHDKKDEIEIKYVHQLQNLVFALTGKELIKQ